MNACKMAHPDASDVRCTLPFGHESEHDSNLHDLQWWVSCQVRCFCGTMVVRAADPRKTGKPVLCMKHEALPSAPDGNVGVPDGS